MTMNNSVEECFLSAFTPEKMNVIIVAPWPLAKPLAAGGGGKIIHVADNNIVVCLHCLY